MHRDRTKNGFRFTAGILLLALLLVFVQTAFAASPAPDLTKKGSITLTLRDGSKKAVPGGEMTLCQVAAITEENGGLSYAWVNGFEDCGLSPDNPDDAALARQLEQKRTDHTNQTTLTIGADGTVLFSELSPGLYLLVQTKAASGYNPVSSFLVSVPMQSDGTYIYEVNASPKVETVSQTPQTPKKTDTPRPSVLPKTGQLNWPVPILTVGGLLLFALGWSLSKRKMP